VNKGQTFSNQISNIPDFKFLFQKQLF